MTPNKSHCLFSVTTRIHSHKEKKGLEYVKFDNCWRIEIGKGEGTSQDSYIYNISLN